MPIEKTTAYKVGDKFCEELSEAQIESIAALFLNEQGYTVDAARSIGEQIYSHRTEIIAILSMEDDTPKPRKARKDKGKPRKSNQPELLPAA